MGTQSNQKLTANKLIFVLPIVCFIFSCGSPKISADSSVSSADYPYMERFHEGVRQKAKGQVSEAIKTFESCLLIKPTDDAVVYALAQCHLMQDEKQKAALYTEKASKLDPKNIWYTQELAYMYFEQGKLAEASTCFKKLVAEQPKNVDWLFGYAELLKRTGKNEEALSNYDKMEDQLGIIPEISIEKFNLYTSLKQDEKALQCLLEARRLYPDDINLIGTLIDYYFQKREINKAKEMLNELVRTNPNNGRAHLALADLAMREQRKEDAYNHFKQAFIAEGVDIETKNSVLSAFSSQQVTMDKEVIELAQLVHEQHPDNATALAFLGDFYLRNDKKTEALTYLKKSLKANDNNYNTWNQVLMLEYQLFYFDSLYKDARACSALFPTLSNVQLLYAEACSALEHYEETIEAVNLGIESVVNDNLIYAEFQALKAHALYVLKKSSEGKALYLKAIDKDPTNSRIKLNYAQDLAKYENALAEAKKIIEQTFTNLSKNAAYYASSARISFIEKDYQNALIHIKNALELEPNHPYYYELLGDIYFMQNQANQALEAWNKSNQLGNSKPLLRKKISTQQYHATY